MPCPNTEYQTLAINCVYLVSVHPPIVPTLKMAVWLCLPCAGGPNSGRKSDAQRPFPRIQDAQSHVCLNYSNSCLHMRKKTKQQNIGACSTLRGTSSRNRKYFYFTRFVPVPIRFLATLRAHPHRRITSWVTARRLWMIAVCSLCSSGVSRRFVGTGGLL